MTLKELTDNVEYLTDASGQRKAVVLELCVWEALLRLLEEIDGSSALNRDGVNRRPPSVKTAG